MKSAVSLLILLGGLSFAAVGAELYKWVDENGVVHYSQTPPEGHQTSEVEVKEEYSRDPSPAGESVYAETIEQQKARRELERQQKEFERLEREAVENDEAMNTANCTRAMRDLDTLQKQCPVFYDGAGIMRAQCPRSGYYYYEGERTYVEDEKRQELILFYTSVIEKCKELQR